MPTYNYVYTVLNFGNQSLQERCQ